MEEEISAERMQISPGTMSKWPVVEPTALPQSGMSFYLTYLSFSTCFSSLLQPQNI